MFLLSLFQRVVRNPRQLGVVAEEGDDRTTEGTRVRPERRGNFTLGERDGEGEVGGEEGDQGFPHEIRYLGLICVNIHDVCSVNTLLVANTLCYW